METGLPGEARLPVPRLCFWVSRCRQTGTPRLGWARGQGQGQCSCPKKPCTQIGGLAPLPVVGDGCRGGDALFLPSYALLLSAPVALGLKPPCGDERGGQQHRPPLPRAGCSCQARPPVPAPERRSGASWYPRSPWWEGGVTTRCCWMPSAVDSVAVTRDAALAASGYEMAQSKGTSG